MMKLLGFRKPKVDFWFFVKVIVILAMLFFLVYPFSTLITRSFFTKKVDGMTFDNYATFFSKKYYLDALKNTLYITFFSSLTCLLVGAPMAYLMTRYNIFGKKIIYVCIILALMSPPFIGAYSWILLFGRAGFVTKLFASIGIKTPTIYGPGGIILVFTLHLYPYVYLYVSGALSSIDSSLEEAGENLGSSKIRRLFTVTLPVVMPSILAGVVMVFMTSLADFGTPMLLGEGKTRVLPVLVYDAYMSEIGGDANMASTLSVIVVACSLSVLLLQKYYVARKNYAMTSLRPPKVVELRGWKRFLVTLPVAIVAFLGLLPQLTVVISSFFRDGFYRLHWRVHLGELRENLKPAENQYHQYLLLFCCRHCFYRDLRDADFLHFSAQAWQGCQYHGSSGHVPLCDSGLCFRCVPDCGFQPPTDYFNRYSGHYDRLLCGEKTALYRALGQRLPLSDGCVGRGSLGKPWHIANENLL